MRTIGFPISDKENENRRAILPTDLMKIRHPECIYIEKGYGKVLGIDDEQYVACGCHLAEHEEVLDKDIICDAKIGDAGYLKKLKEGKTIFGWIHAVQNKDITDILLDRKLTAYAWEDMFEEGRHCFWRNNEIAGEAAIMNAFHCHGLMPYNTKVALWGKGNVARGALKILTLLGADVTVYDRRTESLFQKELGQYDVIVNGILWDTKRKDHIIYKEDLKRMKKGAMIIDISCDAHGGIETSEATTIDHPTYEVEGILHYVVDHTPSLFYKTASQGISEEVGKYLDDLCERKENPILTQALIMNHGMIIDERINEFQGRTI